MVHRGLQSKNAHAKLVDVGLPEFSLLEHDLEVGRVCAALALNEVSGLDGHAEERRGRAETSGYYYLLVEGDLALRTLGEYRWRRDDAVLSGDLHSEVIDYACLIV